MRLARCCALFSVVLAAVALLSHASQSEAPLPLAVSAVALSDSAAPALAAPVVSAATVHQVARTVREDSGAAVAIAPARTEELDRLATARPCRHASDPNTPACTHTLKIPPAQLLASMRPRGTHAGS